MTDYVNVWATLESSHRAHAFINPLWNGAFRTAMCSPYAKVTEETTLYSRESLENQDFDICRYCSKEQKKVVERAATPSERSNIDATAEVGYPGGVDWGAQVRDRAYVGPQAFVRDHAIVKDRGRVAGRSSLNDSAHVSEFGHLVDDAQMYEQSVLRGRAALMGNSRVYGDAVVEGNAALHGAVIVDSNARIHGRARIDGVAYVGEDADVFDPRHVITLVGVTVDPVTVYRTKTGHKVKAGCQTFTLDTDLTNLAENHGWILPTHWPVLVQFLRDTVAEWADDVCTVRCCRVDKVA